MHTFSWPLNRPQKWTFICTLHRIIVSRTVRIWIEMLHCYFLSLLQEVLHRSKNTLHFIRLHGPWPLLCRYAEELNLRAPIQVTQSDYFCAARCINIPVLLPKNKNKNYFRTKNKTQIFCTSKQFSFMHFNLSFSRPPFLIGPLNSNNKKIFLQLDKDLWWISNWKKGWKILNADSGK